jgi:hypothetical protein
MTEQLRGLGDVIAREVISGIKADGSAIAITVEIGRPFPWGDTTTTTWACTLRVDPLLDREVYGEAREVYGEGSLQALCLAVWVMRGALDQFQNEGGKLVWDDGASLSSYWPRSPDSY